MLGLAICALLLIAMQQFQIDLPALLRSALENERLVFDAQIVAAVVLLVLIAQITGFDRFIWHMGANAMALEKPRLLFRFHVIDGDTIEGDGVRYRLANIDAPETGDNAKCFRERERGEEAARVAHNLVLSAAQVTVRRTWRTDIYNRRIAFIAIDGKDLGEALIARGLAVPWRGRRLRWCGKRGGLARIARGGVRYHACATCRHWR